uniref:Uncharacterized protein n=1 Tax=Onchocerca volvulus TaxID=6282 RepID=A0A8R1XVX3_ONCVO
MGGTVFLSVGMLSLSVSNLHEEPIKEVRSIPFKPVSKKYGRTSRRVQEHVETILRQCMCLLCDIERAHTIELPYAVEFNGTAIS